MAKKRGNILIVDDNEDITEALRFLLEDEYEKVFTLNNPKFIPATLNEQNIDIVILDLNYTIGEASGEEGLFWLNQIISFNNNIVVIIITAYGDIGIAVKALKIGAFDFIPKPWDNDKILSTINAALKLHDKSVEFTKLKAQHELYKQEFEKKIKHIVGNSSKMQRVLELVEKASPTDANILIAGENGTGKSLLARQIHALSERKNKAFVNVDLGALNENLFESELFGHVKGAFTDAKNDYAGRFEIAHEGTLFLDEIANLPLNLQPKLLSALQNRKISRLGSNKEVEVNIRLISATNKKVNSLVQQQMFREDLLYRINTIQIELPPLRERIDDIPVLTEMFLKKYSKKYRKDSVELNAKAKNSLLKYSWPGNIRELDHTIEKAVILCNNNIISPEDLYIRSQLQTPYKSINTLEEIEKQAIINTLESHNWNITEVAKELAISRQSIYNKMKKYGL